ncbi:C45 family autoproteolytic acyltransferase/hydolase [Paenibacillus sp. FSL R7-0331]|uniref:C45 family autoproteolytic acyltransferase/hydolase n=1 Tax=Paenibacillus sp. FSL R7-0331 TaxID=1536773 RepID=UPI0004F76F18|nr:C45 family peptidase [Paenibacillus sp. FSL R7-0331]AIQ52961.1 hypothetical protein R70331_16470 [Paenibacillus sp. FSL R7-0331]
MSVKTAVYRHVVTEGTHYEVGRALGACFSQNRELIDFLTSPFMGAAPLKPEAAERAMEQFEQYCPGLNQEIRGFADETGVPAENIVFYYSYVQPAGYCSQAAVSTGTGSGSRTYHMRTYDFGWEDAPYNQLLLSTTRVKGKPAHTGFALQLFGRYDGMNEEGLCITTTSGRIRPALSETGFVFPGVARAVLDSCATALEAASLLRSMPISDFRNFLISDRHGCMALVETAGSSKDIEYLGAATADSHKLAVSANHYTLSAMQPHNLQIMPNSLARARLMQHSLSQVTDPQEIIAVMKQLTGNSFPQGISCHHYSEGLGTLWSMICDNAARELHVCFGSPQLNPWRTFGCSNPPGISEYYAKLPDEPSCPDFWRD